MEDKHHSIYLYDSTAYDNITPDSWLKQYRTDSKPIHSVKSDHLDIATIERRVQQLTQEQDVSGGFCSRCQYLLDHWPARETGRACAVGQTYSTEEIEASSRSGCKLCAFLWSRLQLSGHLDTFRKIEARLRALKHRSRCSLTIQDLGQDDRIQFIWLNFPGKEEVTQGSPAAQLVQFVSLCQPITTKVPGERMDRVTLAKSWLSKCTTSHEGCRPVRQYKRPGRLISVYNDTVRLVETEAWDHMPEYATLSYCWGRVPFIKLTRETLPSFFDSISFESLPRTFQDAIRLTRELGLEFIWIDALCIIQNEQDHRDWLKESGRMDSIYGGSLVTFSATSASDAFQGFFPTGAPKYSGGFVARTQTDQISRVQNFHSPELHQDTTITTHLGTRGWTFQEKLLSPRTIYIGDYGLYWECRSSTKSEFIPDGFTELRPSGVRICSEDQEWDWREIINTYSKMKLTVDSDKLPALSGIASHQHELTGDQYLAGLWKTQLMEMLAWHREGAAADRPAWRAPTWSWASINSGCIMTYECDYEGMKPQAVVLDAWTKTVGSNPFGGVVDGEITLACTTLVSANLNRIGVEEYWERMLMYSDLEYETQLPHLIFPGHESSPLRVVLDCLDKEMQVEEEHVILLPLFEGLTGGAMERLEPRDSDDEASEANDEASETNDEASGNDDEASGKDDEASGNDDQVRARTVNSKSDTEEEELMTEQSNSPSVEEASCSGHDQQGWIQELVVTGIILRPMLDAPGHYTRLGHFSFTNIPIDTQRDLYQEFDGFRKEAGEEAAKSGCIRMISSDEHPQHKYVISIK